MNDLIKYLIENGRSFTKEEQDAYDKSIDKLYKSYIDDIIDQQLPFTLSNHIGKIYRFNNDDVEVFISPIENTYECRFIRWQKSKIYTKETMIKEMLRDGYYFKDGEK